MEVHIDTAKYGYRSQRFKETFMFQHNSPSRDIALQEIKRKLFNEEEQMKVRLI
jgi:hypothetical protein